MGIRVGAVAATAAVLLTSASATPAATGSCEEPGPAHLGAVSGHAGETVSFALSGTPRGAHYSITVEGVAAGRGRDTDPAPGTQAALTIPDLGPTARAVDAIVTVSCERGGGSERSLTVNYAGRAPAAAAAPAQSAAPAAGQAAPTARAPAGRPTGRSSRRSRDDGAVKGVRHGFSGLGPAVLDMRKTRERARGREARQRKERRKRKRKARKRNLLDQDGAAVRPRRPQPGEGGAELSGGEIELPRPAVAWTLLAAVALAGAVTILLLAWRTRRRRMLVR